MSIMVKCRECHTLIRLNDRIPKKPTFFCEKCEKEKYLIDPEEFIVGDLNRSNKEII